MPAAAVVGGSALIGAIGGAMSSGPQLDTTGLNAMHGAYSAYQNLVNAGPGAGDVTAATDAQRKLAATYQSDSANPMNMYNFAAGNQLANQQFSAQRQQLATSLQQQINQAGQAAAAAGRSSYDPILQSRLASQAMQSTASLNAQQQSAAMGYAGQIGQQQLQNQVNQTSTLQNLASQAYSNQSNLFSMGNSMQSANNQSAQYQMSQGGGLKGALTGLAGGIGGGMSVMGGLAQMGAANSMANYYNNMSPGAQQANALNNFQFNQHGMSSANYMMPMGRPS